MQAVEERLEWMTQSELCTQLRDIITTVLRYQSASPEELKLALCDELEQNGLLPAILRVNEDVRVGIRTVGLETLLVYENGESDRVRDQLLAHGMDLEPELVLESIFSRRKDFSDDEVEAMYDRLEVLYARLKRETL